MLRTLLYEMVSTISSSTTWSANKRKLHRAWPSGGLLQAIFNIRRRYHKGGLERAIEEAARSGQPPKFNGKSMARITAIACSKPPEGHARWSLRLLADRVIELDIVEEISHQSIHNILKKTNSSLT